MAVKIFGKICELLT